MGKSFFEKNPFSRRIFIQKNAPKAPFLGEKNRSLIRHKFRLQNQKQPPEWRHHLLFGPHTQKNFSPHG